MLWETDIAQQQIRKGSRENTPILFASDDGAHQLPFDLLSAIFFLLSRYEEYLSFTPDKHGRYPATNSILFREGLLEQPIVDEWVEKFRQLLRAQYSLVVDAPRFSFQPSYDIDIAWSYKYKGAYRTLGALAKNILSGDVGVAKRQLNVLSGKEQDPYDSFDWLEQLHKRLGLSPNYYVLASLKTTPFDKNIHPQHPEMQKLIRSLAGEGSIGLHPSYYGDEKQELLGEEKASLEKIIGKKITSSRQHYIKLTLPDTYRALMSIGISNDYSMGYGTHLGFRAGTGQSFFWFDIQSDKQSPLRVHPFCFMDTTAHFDHGLTVDAAFEKLYEMAQRLKACNSQLTTIFHNFSLGTDKQWSGWKEAYSAFVQKIIS
ncbi:polysaccharide deacetylase family protein [Polluticoccus soli]|uniref:polysaccharide deacetylase family protein n=1 Tax=Polluticoccus soli TaxID=3034150 RepID=UPI0023E16105|nr:polysaccharide deacetylase family protein [Flavipsychrobacter sp. JY13-12]